MIKIKAFGSGSSGNSYLLDDGYSQLMIECGLPFKKVLQEMRFNFNNVAGCLISHEHRDHCKAVAQMIDSTSIDFYSTQGTFEAMSDDTKLKIYFNDYYRFKFLKYKETREIGTWQVTAFKTQHDAKEPCGFMIDNTSADRLIFLTDSYYVTYTFPDVTHLMVEMNFDEELVDANQSMDKQRRARLKAGHFNAENALKFIKVNKGPKLQEVWLLHLSDANSNEAKFKSDTQKLTGVPVYIA